MQTVFLGVASGMFWTERFEGAVPWDGMVRITLVEWETLGLGRMRFRRRNSSLHGFLCGWHFLRLWLVGGWCLWQGGNWLRRQIVRL